MIGLFMFSFSCNSGKVLLKRDSRWRLVGGGLMMMVDVITMVRQIIWSLVNCSQALVKCIKALRGGDTIPKNFYRDKSRVHK